MSTVYLFCVSFAGLGLGRGTAGLDYKTGFMCRECRWFRHKTDSYDTQKNADKTSDGAKKRAKVGKRGSLTAVDRLSDSMPSLALRSLTTNQRPQTDTGIGHQKRSSRDTSTPSSNI